jgi:hypothetical protein
MSRLQNYLLDITKKANEITTKQLEQNRKNKILRKSSTQKLSKKDLNTLKKLKDQAITAAQAKATEAQKEQASKISGFSSFLSNKQSQNTADFDKAQALKMITRGYYTIDWRRGSGSTRGTGGRRIAGAAWNPGSGWDEETSQFESWLYAVSKKKMEAIPGSNVGYNQGYVDKDTFLKTLNSKVSSKTGRNTYGFNQTQLDYLNQLFSNESFSNKVFNKSPFGDNKKYLKLGEMRKAVSDVLNPNTSKNYGSLGFSQYGTYNPLTKLYELDTSSQWKNTQIRDFENKNLINSLKFSQIEKNLLDQYKDKGGVLSNLDLSSYNKLIAEADANRQKMYNSLNVYLNTAGMKKTENRQNLTYDTLWMSNMAINYADPRYKYGLDDAKKYAKLIEGAYSKAYGELQKSLGISGEQYEQAMKTKEETVSNVDRILKEQKKQKTIGTKLGTSATSRREAASIAASQDAPIISRPVQKKASFIERPS